MVFWKMRSLSKFYPSLEISHNLLMGLGVSDFVSVSHIFAILSNTTLLRLGLGFENASLGVSVSLRFTIRHP